MKKVKITAIRKVQYDDLMAKYENPIEHTCDVCEGQSWVSEDGKCPEGLCPEAWKTMKEFVEALAQGEGNFYDGWMKNPYSAMISCNDGFRPGIMTPTVAARMTATLDQISNGRLLINVVAGGDPVELAGDGVFAEHGERYKLTDEFLDIWRDLSASDVTGKAVFPLPAVLTVQYI